MKNNYEESIFEKIQFTNEEIALVNSKKSNINRISFAVLLKKFQIDCTFPKSNEEVSISFAQAIGELLDIDYELFYEYKFDGRTYKFHKAQIREYYDFNISTNESVEELINWLNINMDYNDLNSGAIRDLIKKWSFKNKRQLPVQDRIAHIEKSVIYKYEERFFKLILSHIDDINKKAIHNIIASPESDDEKGLFKNLKADPGRLGLDTIFDEIKKLKKINSITLPESILNRYPMKFLKVYKERVASEDITEIRRHPDHILYAMLICFLFVRKREINDNLVELLIQVTHKIKGKAEKRIEKEFIKDLKKVTGKNNILFKIAEKSLEEPEGVIKDTIYPIVNVEILKDLVKEYKTSGVTYQKKVYTVMRNSYSRHYRRMLPELLEILEFKSNNDQHKPIIEAIDLIKKYIDKKIVYYPYDEDIPIEGVVKNKWKDIVLETDLLKGHKINRINYEIVLLITLRDKLRCKEIWIPNADKFRNPEEDLPKDFSEKKEKYYEDLKQPLDSGIFVNNIKNEMEKALKMFNYYYPKNEKVNINLKRKPWITLSPIEPQPEPQNIMELKNIIINKWPMTNLLDILKETDLIMKFTDEFKTLGLHERLDKEILQERLILSLFALGTNTGLKRIASGNNHVKYKDLLYIRRKFITKENLRNAISKVVNGILKIRMENIWGSGTTSCASDSKKFGSWDQNLMTEWHIRYRGRGVMIYWHVEKKSACIYSQLKSCSSSEVSAMIEGLLRHCTDMNIEKNFTDTHGQSEIAFAFCHLLGFNLNPRIKNIGTQRLYMPYNEISNELGNIKQILTRSIKWDLIHQQYDQLIKYATALRLGTADTESILRRFTRNNIKHPTYLALAELGKALKTIFLCNYLNSEELRSEIQKGLNVIENWNSANGFIFYGKGGEIATNRLDDQEIAVLSLHLLQNCMVYINTIMVQEVIKNKNFMKKMTTEDTRALNPLFYMHINPYGSFELDMSKRIDLSLN